MNIDTKILHNKVENQIQEYVKTIINHDHVLFIPGMQSWFTIQKSINITCYSNKIQDKKLMIISTDAEKIPTNSNHLS